MNVLIPSLALLMLVTQAATPLAEPASKLDPQQSSVGTAQGEQGGRLYAARCASCHGRDLAGGAGPALRAKTLFTQQHNATAADLDTWIRVNMPLNAPLSLSTEESRAVTAWLLRRNDLYRDPAPLTSANMRNVKLESQ